AESRDGLDEARIACVIPQDLAQLDDALRERLFGDGRVFPQAIEKLSFTYEPVAVLDEIQQQVESFRTKVLRRPANDKAPRGWIDMDFARLIGLMLNEVH